MRVPLPEIQVRNLRINPPLLLAPMVGLTHSALRQILFQFGGLGLASTEMLSARRLPGENASVSPYLIRTPSEKPLSYQLLVSCVEEIAPAIDKLHEMKAEAIDLNMGCPAPAVGKFGAGVNLMDQPEHVSRIVAEARKCTPLPLSAKIRLGSNLNERKLKTFCTMLEQQGIDMLSVHARLKEESFARNPRWKCISQVKEWIHIPVIANGGIFSVEDARECLRISDADGLMLGRGAVIKPWLFVEIARELFGMDGAAETVSLPAIYDSFLALLQEHFRPEYRLGRLKQFTHYFAKNFKFGHYLASRVQSSSTVQEAQERAHTFFDSAV